MTIVAPLVTFNPKPRIERVAITGAHACFVVDDALVEPQRLVRFAVEQAKQFNRVDFNAYPGVLLPTPGEISEKLATFFNEHIRPLFDARRVLSMHSRLALVTLAPDALRPYQRICHSDDSNPDPRQSLQASVLYLFEDPGLGGTGFYRSRMPLRETMQLFSDASALPTIQFQQRYDIQQGYLCGSNRHFERVGGVDAKFNRMIFYDGALLHSGDIVAPERLSADPRIGRLTLNGFFTSRRRAV